VPEPVGALNAPEHTPLEVLATHALGFLPRGVRHIALRTVFEDREAWTFSFSEDATEWDWKGGHYDA
jgi:hypothetical protein